MKKALNRWANPNEIAGAGVGMTFLLGVMDIVSNVVNFLIHIFQQGIFHIF